MPKFQPFSDDSASLSLGDLTVENGTSKVVIYGSMDLTKDKDGLKQARALKAVVDAVVKALSQEQDLPDKAVADEPTQQVKNPFA